ncbi:hypothetical protein [Luteolibacter soli]|uniref:hypothetical protein n=1 Tax=Luteolibacter soli TaxID=3135280 RepID=UPI00311A0E12
MTKWDTKSEPEGEPEPEGATPQATAFALVFAVAPICCFGLSLGIFLADHSRPSEVSQFFSFLMMASIMLAPTIGALFVREGNRRKERWEGWRRLVTVVNILWALAAVWLGFGMLLSPGRNW